MASSNTPNKKKDKKMNNYSDNFDDLESRSVALSQAGSPLDFKKKKDKNLSLADPVPVGPITEHNINEAINRKISVLSTSSTANTNSNSTINKSISNLTNFPTMFSNTNSNANCINKLSLINNIKLNLNQNSNTKFNSPNRSARALKKRLQRAVAAPRVNRYKEEAEQFSCVPSCRLDYSDNDDIEESDAEKVPIISSLTQIVDSPVFWEDFILESDKPNDITNSNSNFTSNCRDSELVISDNENDVEMKVDNVNVIPPVQKDECRMEADNRFTILKSTAHDTEINTIASTTESDTKNNSENQPQKGPSQTQSQTQPQSLLKSTKKKKKLNAKATTQSLSQTQSISDNTVAVSNSNESAQESESQNSLSSNSNSNFNSEYINFKFNPASTPSKLVDSNTKHSGALSHATPFQSGCGANRTTIVNHHMENSTTINLNTRNRLRKRVSRLGINNNNNNNNNTSKSNFNQSQCHINGVPVTGSRNGNTTTKKLPQLNDIISEFSSSSNNYASSDHNSNCNESSEFTGSESPTSSRSPIMNKPVFSSQSQSQSQSQSNIDFNSTNGNFNKAKKTTSTTINKSTSNTNNKSKNKFNSISKSTNNNTSSKKESGPPKKKAKFAKKRKSELMRRIEELGNDVSELV